MFQESSVLTVMANQAMPPPRAATGLMISGLVELRFERKTGVDVFWARCLGNGPL